MKSHEDLVWLSAFSGLAGALLTQLLTGIAYFKYYSKLNNKVVI